MSTFWTGARVRLRGIEPTDWEAFMRVDADSDDQRSTDMLHPPRSAEGYRQWAADQARATPVGDAFTLAVESLAGGEMVGSISTHAVDQRAGRFAYGVGIGRAHQRQGYAADAVVLLLRFMFAERRYHRCEARVVAYNEASLALQRRLGFVEEGRLRDHEFYAGRHHDMVVLGMTAPEFAARYPLSTDASSSADPR